MLSVFPNFKKLEISDKSYIERHTKKFPPYSDFNFASLWAWNQKENVEISILNNNLVVKFQDYTVHNYFYSFIGDNEIIKTIDALLSLSKKKNFEENLKLIPESNFSKIEFLTAKKHYLITEDNNNHDYILDVKKLSTMEGKELHHKRKRLNNFLKNNSYDVSAHILNISDKQSVIDLFFLWEKLRNKNREETKNELDAINRLFTNVEELDLTIINVANHKGPIGYTIFEIIDDEYAISNFQKADPRYIGSYELLNFEMAKYLYKERVKSVNIEQDLGIEGLRRAKLDYNPTYLKKYIIKRK